MATSFFSHAFAPGASLSAQYQYVSFALFGSSAPRDVFDAAPAANTAALRMVMAPRTANTCFLAISPPLVAQVLPGRACPVDQWVSTERRLGQHLAPVDDQR